MWRGLAIVHLPSYKRVGAHGGHLGKLSPTLAEFEKMENSQ
jgi:hypothetical protein